MNIIHYAFALVIAFSLVFAGEAEAKHGSDKARSRVLKEISQKGFYTERDSKISF